MLLLLIIISFFWSINSFLQSLQRFTADLSGAQAAAGGESLKQLALLCLGEVGQQQDLSGLVDLKNQVLACFESRYVTIVSFVVLFMDWLFRVIKISIRNILAINNIPIVI